MISYGYSLHIQSAVYFSRSFDILNSISNYIVVYDQILNPQYIEHACAEAKLFVPWPSGESTKSLSSYAQLTTHLTPYVTRDTTLVAIGGGTIGDLCGFVAATLLRGIDWIFFPTTLLSQVDSSIGGKTGINCNDIKNIIGCFYPPKITVCHADFLKTLPIGQLQSGYVELLKHALMCDKQLFNDLDNHFKSLNDLYDVGKLEKFIEPSVRLKLKIIGNDFLEKNYSDRIFLNLGHTFGHGIETLSNFTIPHGIAVGIGIIIAYRYAIIQGLNSFDDLEKIIDHFNRLSLPISCTFSAQDMISVMSHDKKKNKDGIRVILPKGLGQGCVIQNLDSTILEKIM